VNLTNVNDHLDWLLQIYQSSQVYLSAIYFSTLWRNFKNYT